MELILKNKICVMKSWYRVVLLWCELTVKFYCVQHSGLQKLTRPGGVTTATSRGGGHDISDSSKSRLHPAGPGMIDHGAHTVTIIPTILLT